MSENSYEEDFAVEDKNAAKPIMAAKPFKPASLAAPQAQANGKVLSIE